MESTWHIQVFGLSAYADETLCAGASCSPLTGQLRELLMSEYKRSRKVCDSRTELAWKFYENLDRSPAATQSAAPIGSPPTCLQRATRPLRRHVATRAR